VPVFLSHEFIGSEHWPHVMVQLTPYLPPMHSIRNTERTKCYQLSIAICYSRYSGFEYVYIIIFSCLLVWVLFDMF